MRAKLVCTNITIFCLLHYSNVLSDVVAYKIGEWRQSFYFCFGFEHWWWHLFCPSLSLPFALSLLLLQLVLLLLLLWCFSSYFSRLDVSWRFVSCVSAMNWMRATSAAKPLDFIVVLCLDLKLDGPSQSTYRALYIFSVCVCAETKWPLFVVNKTHVYHFYAFLALSVVFWTNIVLCGRRDRARESEWASERANGVGDAGIFLCETKAMLLRTDVFEDETAFLA